jgi:hypothetical protein
MSEQISSSRELQLNNEIISHYIQTKIKAGNLDNKGWEEYQFDTGANKGEDYEGLAGEDMSFDSLD